MKPMDFLRTITVMATLALFWGSFVVASATSLSDLLVGNPYSSIDYSAEPLGKAHQFPHTTHNSHSSSPDDTSICGSQANNASHGTAFDHGAERPVEQTTKECETPEPGTLLLLGLGLMGIASYRRFQNKRKGR